MSEGKQGAMTEAHQEESLAKAVGHLRRISVFLAKQLEVGEFKAPGPTQNLVGRLAIAVVRQAEAIAALYQAGPYYRSQVGQLLRGLLEMWRVGAWLAEPETILARNQRAIGLWLMSLSEERKTLDLQAEIPELNTPAERWEELERQEQLLSKAADELLNGAKAKQTGGARNDYQRLGRPDRYVAFRRESEAAHVGAIALGQMVAFQDDSHVHLGGKSPIADRARKLVIARDVLVDVTIIVLQELGRDDAPFAEVKDSTYQAFEELLGPIIGLDGIE